MQYLLEICNVRPDIPDEVGTRSREIAHIHLLFQLGWTPLMIAVSTGHIEIVRMLLQTNKVDIEQSNSSGARPLHYACSKNFYEVKQSN